MAWTPPQSTQIIPVRPLTIGVRKDVTTQMLPPGAFRVLENTLVTERGLQRRGGLRRYGVGPAIPERIQDVAAVWQDDGTKPLAVIGDGKIYRFTPVTDPDDAAWTYSEAYTLAVDIAGVATLNASAPIGFIDGWVAAGDIVTITDDFGSGVETLSWPVLQITNDHVLVLDGYAESAVTVPSGDWSIQLIMGRGASGFTDWAVIGQGAGTVFGGLLFTEGTRPLARWDSDTNSIAFWTADPAKKWSGEDFVCDCTSFFMDRVWAGAITNASEGYKRQRIIWSALADSSNFAVATNYVDLPYLGSSVKRLVPMGDRLVAYFADGIFVGIPTNYPLLPLRFERIETGGVGLIGARAVVPWFGGHFLVGQDNIYWLAYGAPALEPIGTGIFAAVIRGVSDPTNIRASTDPEISSIVFGFPRTGTDLEDVWYFHTRLKAWSQAVMNVETFSNIVTSNSNAWDALSGLTWDTIDTVYPTWDSFSDGGEVAATVYGNAGYLWTANDDVNTDYGAEPIDVVIETGDIDFDSPETTKNLTRLSLKIDRIEGYDEAVAFTVQGSTNKGRSWRTLGTLRISATMDEGKVDFRLSGSTHRLRISSSSLTTKYSIAEYSLAVCGNGDELSFGMQT